MYVKIDPPKGRPPHPGSPKYLGYLAQRKAAAGHELNEKEMAALEAFVKTKPMKMQALTSTKPLTVDEATPVLKPVKERSDAEILKDTEEQFSVLHELTHGACNHSIRALIVSGPGGCGKTHTVSEVINYYLEENSIKAEFAKSGMITPVMMYRLLWKNRFDNSVIVFDDVDNIFDDPDTFSLLKGALDTGKTRKITWMSNSKILSDEGIPESFAFEGTIIFITNINMQQIADSKLKMAPHMGALITRVLYLDLNLHGKREMLVWVNYLVKKAGILIQKGLKAEQQQEALDWMNAHADELRQPSLRTIIHIGSLMKMNGKDWPKFARKTILKRND